MQSDFTVVCAVDAKYIEQLEWSSKAWKLCAPGLFERPWIVYYDADARGSELRERIEEALHFHRSQVRVMPWPWPNNERYKFSSQREKMLAAFVNQAPADVETPYWLKLDTDAVPAHLHGGACFWEPKWFVDNPKSGDVRYDVIAPAWNYTKPADQMAKLDAWSRTVPALAQIPPLNLPFDPAGTRCVHKRFCSWLSFYRTAWTSSVAKWLFPYYPGLPVPSQDGIHSYCAALTAAKVKHVNFKRRGWTNISRTRALKQHVDCLLSSPD